MDKQQEPRLRFKGFTGAWECKKLGEISTSYSGGTPIVGNAKFYGGTIPFIRSGEIHSSKTELFLTQEGLENSSTKLVKKGDILYALYGATSGEVGRSQIDGAINQAILAIIPKENYKAEFISQWLKINKENIVSLYLQGGQGNLSGEIVKKIEISFPSSKEQTHLGLFFRRLDSQIAESRAVLEKSRQLKKAMLAKMFPANGEKIPKIRFEGFEGEWKREILKDVVNVFDNLRIPVSENKRTSGNTPYFGANGIQDYVDGFTHNGEFVLIAEDGANDLKNYPVQYVNGKCWVNNHAHVLQGKSEILNNIFLFSRFQSMDISQFLVGGGRAKLNGSTMLEIEIEFPKDKKEQTAIGLFFRQLDETIALQTAEVEKLNQLKKGLLAAMLV